jgi:DNA repair exonuclease SbcCD ATPase subunit
VVRIEWPDGAPATPAMLEEQRTELVSDAVLAGALARLAKAGGAPEPYGGPDAVARLRADLRVERVPGADCISVRLEGGPEDRRAPVVRAVLEAFVQSRSEHESSRGERRKKIETERDSLRPRIADAERQLADLRSKLGLATTDPAADERRVRLDALRDLATRKQPEFEAARDAWQEFKDLYVRAAEADNTAILYGGYPELAEEVEREPKVIAARVLAEEMERQAEEVAKTHGEAADVMIALRVQVEKARADLAERRIEAFKERLEQKAAMLKRQADLAERDQAELARETAEARAAAERIAPDVETFRRHENELADLRARLGEVEEALTRLRVEAAVGRPAATVVQWP